jgi:hypothetical protein
MATVTTEELQNWAHSSCTQHFLKEVLRESLEEIKSSWASQSYQAEGNTSANDRALGYVRALQQAIEVIEEMGQGTWTKL